MKIVSAKPLGSMPVYDLSIDHDDHSFIHGSGVVLHNCGYVICNEPISNFIPLTSVSDVQVTQYTAKSVEESGGVKMDYLSVNSLADIAAAIKLIQKRSGWPDKVPDLKLKDELFPGIRLIPPNG